MSIHSSKSDVGSADKTEASRPASRRSAQPIPFAISLLALIMVVTQPKPAFAWSDAGFEQPQQEKTLEPISGQTEATQPTLVPVETPINVTPPTPMPVSAMETPTTEVTPTTVPQAAAVNAPPVALQQSVFESASGQSGTILSLSASGGSNFNENITISTTVQAISHTNNSNLYFEIRASNGMVVATHSFGGVPRMSAGETFSYSWTSNNSGYPVMGDYSVTICWSTGGSQNCNIASATTTFYAANSLGWLLTLILVVLVARWLWRKRKVLFSGETT